MKESRNCVQWKKIRIKDYDDDDYKGSALSADRRQQQKNGSSFQRWYVSGWIPGPFNNYKCNLNLQTFVGVFHQSIFPRTLTRSTVVLFRWKLTVSEKGIKMTTKGHSVVTIIILNRINRSSICIIIFVNTHPCRRRVESQQPLQQKSNNWNACALS